MFIVIVRTIILYSIVIIVLRIMGKRQVGELQPYEFAITIMISALAAIPMEDTGIPLVSSMTPILLLLTFQITLSIIALRSSRAREIIRGKPLILIENGKILEEELKNSNININDLMEQLRIKGYPNISDVEFAILETNGAFSVLPKSQKRPLTPEDFNISTNYEGLSYTLIIDGEVQKENLRKLNLSTEWLQTELKKYNINRISDTFFAALDTSGNFIYQKKKA